MISAVNSGRDWVSNECFDRSVPRSHSDAQELEILIIPKLPGVRYSDIWLGKSGISDTDTRGVSDSSSERWCNQLAAEVLVPLDVLRDQLNPGADLKVEVNRLARLLKMSTLVILRRIHDANQISEKQFREAYDAELGRLSSRRHSGGVQLPGGARVSKRFARALVEDTLEGRTSFTEAFRLLGLKKMASFDELVHSLGMGD